MPPTQQPIIMPVPPPMPPRKKSSRLAIGIAIGISAIPALLFIAYALFIFTGIIGLFLFGLGNQALGPSFANRRADDLTSRIRQLPHVKSATAKTRFALGGLSFDAEFTIIGEDDAINDQVTKILKDSVSILQSKFTNIKITYKQSYAGGELKLIYDSMSDIKKHQSDISPMLTALQYELKGGMSHAWAHTDYSDRSLCNSSTNSSSVNEAKKSLIRTTDPGYPGISRIWYGNGRRLDIEIEKRFNGEDFSWLAFDEVYTVISQPEVLAVRVHAFEDEDRSKSIKYSIELTDSKQKSTGYKLSRSEKAIVVKFLKGLRNSQLKTIVDVSPSWPRSGIIISQGNYFSAPAGKYDSADQTANRQGILNQVKCELDESHQKEACSTL